MKVSCLTLALFALTACGGGGNGGIGGGTPPPTGPPTTPTVTMGAETFSPAQITIATGGSVTWTNTSGVVHNVTFDPATGAPANIPDHSSGVNERTFPVAGSFGYQCTLHAGMTGSVVVQ